jgi:hypothetical protein
LIAINRRDEFWLSIWFKILSRLAAGVTLGLVWWPDLLDTALTILNYNLQSSCISDTRRMTIQELSPLGLLPLTNPLAQASKGRRTPSCVPELSSSTVTLHSQCTQCPTSSGIASFCYWVHLNNYYYTAWSSNQ